MTFDVFFIFFTDRMGKLFRENPIQIAFPEAVNLFSARAKFVREGSQKSTVRSHCSLKKYSLLCMVVDDELFLVHHNSKFCVTWH